MDELRVIPIQNIPRVQAGDDLARVLLGCLRALNFHLQNDDVLVVAQKIVSKAEGRRRRLDTVTPSTLALTLAQETGKDPRLVELILRESLSVVRTRPNLIITEHRLGFISANAGIDHSNVSNSDEEVLLLPEDPDASARRLLAAVRNETGAEIAVIISDSHGRPWRLGTVGVAIGVAGLRPLWDRRGEADLEGRVLEVTEVGTADELAAAASLVMGQAAEGIPGVVIRGARYPRGEGCLRDLLRPREMDLFR